MIFRSFLIMLFWNFVNIIFYLGDMSFQSWGFCLIFRVLCPKTLEFTMFFKISFKPATFAKFGLNRLNPGSKLAYLIFFSVGKSCGFISDM